ncbi:hypothetical protein [Luteibacter sp.]|uniref:hypothetical protein n=1 Tax=Luteibacter sp. TaxID=1886636 RepID=UPI0028085129|nr:hypothetical protein [Luteibacter sp.]MDQ8050734.1 hypothetical protein [Luteibacter sp.]
MVDVIAGNAGGIPTDVLTSSALGVRRVQVDIGQTGFFAGREFRAFRELTITATPLVIRVVVPGALKGINIQDMHLTCWQGSIALRAWRLGTPGGTWTSVPVWPNNAIPDVPGYVGQVTIDQGGTLTTPSQQSDALIAYANESGKSSVTSLAGLHGERGLGPGTYYMEFSRLPGTTVDGMGVFTAVWEERLPDDRWVRHP